MKTANKYFLLLLLTIIMLVYFAKPLLVVAAETAEPRPQAADIELTALAAVLIDANSGRVLFEHNAHEQLPMASLTKIFTTMLVLEQVDDLSRIVTAPANFANVGQRSLNILPGQSFTIEELLYANMLRSANDASQLLGIAVSGTEAAFVELMNQRSAELGFTNSSWRNPHGLHHNAHFTTAYEMAQISRLAGEDPVFARIAATRNYTIYRTYRANMTFSNGNRLLTEYRGANGLKTGFTRAAGNCLAGSAERDGLHLIAVVFNSRDTYGEIKQLLDYGFANYSMVRTVSAGEVAVRMPVTNGRDNQVNLVYAHDIGILLPLGAEYSPEPRFEIPESIAAPIYQRNVVGRAYFDDGQGFITAVDLLPAADIDRYTFWGVINIAFQRVMQALLV